MFICFPVIKVAETWDLDPFEMLNTLHENVSVPILIQYYKAPNVMRKIGYKFYFSAFMFAYSQNFCIAREHLQSLTKPLCSHKNYCNSWENVCLFTKLLHSFQKNIEFPDKFCICSRKLSVLSQKYRITRETLCLHTKLLH